MKKDIEWLKREVKKLEDKANKRNQFSSEYTDEEVALENVVLLLSQLDEPEVLSQEWIDEHRETTFDLDEDFETVFIKVENLQNLLVPKQETLSQEWIDDNSTTLPHISPMSKWVSESKLKDILVPKQEEVEEGRVRLIVGFDGGTESYYATDIGDALDFLTDYDARFIVIKEPIIPKFVAEWIESRDYYSVYKVLQDLSAPGSPHASKDVRNWIFRNQENVEKFVRAWLDGYTVEEEQKYYVMNNDNRMMLVRMMDGRTITEADPFKLEDMYEAEKKSHQLTEQEIKDYDERFWPFAVKVEELER